MTFVRNKKENSDSSIVQWYIAVYVRLSKEDGDKLESDSIQNQKRIIEQHIKYLQDQESRSPPWRFTLMTATRAATLTARSISA